MVVNLWPGSVAGLDEERRSLYEARPLFETRLFLTVTYAPPPRGSSRLKGFFFDGLTREATQRIETALDSPLTYFESRLGEIEDHLGGALRLARLDDRASDSPSYLPHRVDPHS